MRDRFCQDCISECAGNLPLARAGALCFHRFGSPVIPITGNTLTSTSPPAPKQQLLGRRRKLALSGWSSFGPQILLFQGWVPVCVWKRASGKPPLVCLGTPCSKDFGTTDIPFTDYIRAVPSPSSSGRLALGQRHTFASRARTVVGLVIP